MNVRGIVNENGIRCVPFSYVLAVEDDPSGAVSRVNDSFTPAVWSCAEEASGVRARMHKGEMYHVVLDPGECGHLREAVKLEGKMNRSDQ